MGREALATLPPLQPHSHDDAPPGAIWQESDEGSTAGSCWTKKDQQAAGAMAANATASEGDDDDDMNSKKCSCGGRFNRTEAARESKRCHVACEFAGKDVNVEWGNWCDPMATLDSR